MTTINYYTGKWQSALRAKAPRLSSTVRLHDHPDAREWDDFNRVLNKAGLALSDEPIRCLPRLHMDVYRIVKARVAL